MAKVKLGLALSSGGARGAAHVGVIKALERAGIVPDVIVGSSMGAEVGGVYAAGIPVDRLETLWRGTSRARVAWTMLPTLPWAGWSSGQAIRSFLHRAAGDPRIEDLPISFGAVVTDLETGQPLAITQGSMVEAVRASVSVPGLFTPVWVDGRLCVDGGVACPLPVRFARALGADIVIGVDVLVDPSEVALSGIPPIDLRQRVLGIAQGVRYAEPSSRRYSPNVFRVLFQMSTVFQKRLCEAQMAKDPPDVLIQPGFSQDPPCYSRVGCAIEAGEEAMQRALPSLSQFLSG